MPFLGRSGDNIPIAENDRCLMNRYPFDLIALIVGIEVGRARGIRSQCLNPGLKSETWVTRPIYCFRHFRQISSRLSAFRQS
jgi:hypothetical protein